MPQSLTAVLENLRELLDEPDITVTPTISQVNAAKLPKLKGRKSNTNNGWKLAVLLPDSQIGFRRYHDGSLDPFHDSATIELAFQIMSHLEENYGIDLVINLGDTLDFPMFGKYEQESAFSRTIQDTMQAGHNFLAMQRAIAPSAQIVFIEGNHDCRMEKYMKKFAPTMQEMRQIGNEGYPVLSVPHILQFDALDITYVGAYPAAKFWINPRLVAVHGTKARSNGLTTTQYLNANPMHTTLFGHCHRLELSYKTHDTAGGPVKNGAFSPGCLCRTDGTVPSYNSGTHLNERPALNHENWQQGMGLVWYRDDGDTEFDIQAINIHGASKPERWAMFEGHKFTVSQ